MIPRHDVLDLSGPTVQLIGEGQVAYIPSLALTVSLWVSPPAAPLKSVRVLRASARS